MLAFWPARSRGIHALSSPLRAPWSSAPLVFLAFALACGGGGDGNGGITPPPPPPPVDNAVASVTVSPGSASVEVASTAQLTATPLNSAGTALSGKTTTWSSNTPDVATINASGVVTGVAVGTASVTAAVDGKSGSAQITVMPSSSQVVASADIGPAGGSLSTADIGFTVAAGGLADTRRLEIRAADVGTHPASAYATGGQFRLNGFPTDREVMVSVRLKAPASTEGVNVIGYRIPAITSNDTIEPVSRMYPARDSAGWMVASVSVRGALSTAGMLSGRATILSLGGGPYPDLLDGMIFGVKSADTLKTTHFEIVSYGAPRATLTPLLSSLLKYLEESYSTVQGMGYAYAYRRTWPLSVSLHPIPEDPLTYAFFARKAPWPLDPELGWFEFNAAADGLVSQMPGIGIHEFFHFTQAQYGDGASANRFTSTGWLKEATSSWIMEKAPSNVLTMKNTFFRGWRDSLFTGLHPGLNADGGYGKGALIKYVTDTWGDGKVKDMFALLGTGISTEDAFVGALPVPSTTWWPDFLVAYMENRVYSLLLGELLPTARMTGFPHPGPVYYPVANAYPASARAFEFGFDTSKLADGADVKFRFRGADSGSFRVMGFQATESGVWKSLGPAADTLVVKGSTLRQYKRIVLLAIRPDVNAPFSTRKSTDLYYEMGLQDGDWMPTKISNVVDRIAYTSTKATDTTRINVAENVTSVAGFLASAGYWKRDDLPTVQFTWTPYPGIADTLARYGIVMSSTLKPVGAGGTPWSYVLTSRFEMGISSAFSAASRAPRGASWWWYLVPVALVPMLGKKRTRRFGALAIGFITVGLVACDIGSISFGGKFAYEFQLPEAAVRYTASAADSTVPVLTYTGATGKLVVESYRSEYWDYIKDDKGEKVDSVRQTRTGAGTATFTYDGLLYHDGKIPKEDDDDVIAAAARMLRVPPAVLRERGGRLLRR